MKQTKLIAAFLAGAILTGTGTYAVCQMERHPVRALANLFGDIDSDGDVNAGDASCILQFSAWKGAGNDGDLAYYLSAPEMEEVQATESMGNPAAEDFIPPEDCDIDTLLNICPKSAPKREIIVYDRQSEEEGAIDFTIHLTDEDYEIIEQFAAEHFPENATLAEKLYITHQWIHNNVDYAGTTEKWNAIVNLSYVDAIFNHKSGQCVQYNGAMASVLAYYGFDVYMVRGWTRPGNQHYWTEVMIAGKTYVVETGNGPKDGDWWQYFFKEWETPGPNQFR